MTWAPPQKPGDRNVLIPEAKQYLDRFSYGKSLGSTDEYTPEFGAALLIWQSRIQKQIRDHGRPGPEVNTSGVFNWSVKEQMGLLGSTWKGLPWIITVGGHHSQWDLGPAYACALPLQIAGKATVQGVGYDAYSLPFNNASGFQELHRIVTQVKPAGVPWAIASHSQGAIITSDYVQQIAGADPTFRGGVHFGNPRRPRGVVAPWVTDPPPPDSEGLAHNVLPGKLPGVEEVSNAGDLYADCTRGQSAEWKTSIYKLVVDGAFTGTDGIAEQIGELFHNFGPEVWAVFGAIVGATGFLLDMSPHDNFHLPAATAYLQRILA